MEDDEVIAKTIRQHLQSWNYEVFAVVDFNSVMEEFARVKPHLVLMDIRLPFHNGFYWCTEIRKVSKLPIIFVSSMNDNMNLVMAINMGGDDFITKPFDLNVLTVKIQAMLRRTYEFAGESHMLEHQGVWLNLSDGTLTYEEQILELSKNERKILCNNRRTRIVSCLVFHTSTNIWCMRINQRYRLTLHVGTHESTV